MTPIIRVRIVVSIELTNGKNMRVALSAHLSSEQSYNLIRDIDAVERTGTTHSFKHHPSVVNWTGLATQSTQPNSHTLLPILGRYDLSLTYIV